MNTQEERKPVFGLKVEPRVYKCARCGHQTNQSTNHTDKTWSFGHSNTCKECPPWAKYPEFGGQTIWEYVGELQ